MSNEQNDELAQILWETGYKAKMGKMGTDTWAELSIDSKQAWVAIADFVRALKPMETRQW